MLRETESIAFEALVEITGMIAEEIKRKIHSRSTCDPVKKSMSTELFFVATDEHQ